MSTCKIVGISGFSGTGKDTVADILVKHHGYVKMGFADILKRICKEVFDFSDEQLWGPSEKRNAPDLRYPQPCYCTDTDALDSAGVPQGKSAFCSCCKGTGTIYLTPRHALQQLGSEWGRSCYPNIWVEYAMRMATKLVEGKILGYEKESGPLTKTFAVYGNVPGPKNVVISDVRFMNEMAAIAEAGGYLVRVTRPSVTISPYMHASELEQARVEDDKFDAMVHNDGSLDDLQQKVEAFLTRWADEEATVG